MTVWKEIVCRDCEHSIRVPDASLAQISLCLPRSSVGAPWLNFLCPQCKHLQLIHVPDGKTLWNNQDQPQPRDDKFLFLVWLECVQKCQPSQIAVVVQVKNGTHVNQVKDDMKTWILSNAECPQGHPPTSPLDISTTMPVMTFL